VIGGLNSLFQDAHTLVMPWLGGDAPDGDLAARQFPFGVKLDAAGRLLLRSAWERNDGALPPLTHSTEILAINGVSTADLLSRLSRFGHGETAGLRPHMLTVMWAQWLDCVFGWRDRFDIDLAESGHGAGQRRVVSWSAGDPWKSDRTAISEQPRLVWFTNDTAILRVPTFDVDEDPEAFSRAVDACFSKMRERGAKTLIIDLRGNTGGQSDAGAVVIQYLIDRPIGFVARARERLNEDNNGLFGRLGSPGSLRDFDLEEKKIQPIGPSKRFTGTTLVWIDQLTYSASILFATAVQDHAIATLIGMSTGGFANQTGNMMPTRLPATGFTAFIATREFLRPNGDVRPTPVTPEVQQGMGEPDGAFLSRILVP